MESPNSFHGISGRWSNLIFNGQDKSLYPEMRKVLMSRFASHGIDHIVGLSDPWMHLSMYNYAFKDAEKIAWTQDEIDDPANEEVVKQRKLKVEDLKLAPSHYKDYIKDKHAYDVKRSMAAAFINEMVPENSPARLCMQMACPELNDAQVMLVALDSMNLANKVSSLLPYVFKFIDLVTSHSCSDSPLAIIDKMNKVKSDFFSITSKAPALNNETAEARTARVAKKSVELFDFLFHVCIVKKYSSHTRLVSTFINTFLRDDLGCPINTLVISDLRNNFNQYISLNISDVDIGFKAVKTNSIEIIDSGKSSKSFSEAHVAQLQNQISNQKKKIENLASRASSAKTVQSAPRPPSSVPAVGAKRVRPVNPNNHPKHDFCKRFHAEGQCYWDPSSDAYNTDNAVNWRAKFPGMKPGNSLSSIFTQTNVVTVSQLPVADSDLADLNEGDRASTSPIIIADGGSDSIIFNYFNLHLFSRLEPYSCAMSGIGGPITNQITHKGFIDFLGVQLVAFYSPFICKSVVSEAVLAINNFSINKYANLCIITNLKNGLSTTSLLENNSYPLSIELFTHDQECHAINLASVRPSNPKTLWHSRFGHAYMGLIIRMAKMPLYRERGLKIPQFLLNDPHDEDLCDACALGKPTFSHAFDIHYRSEIKGQLWYVDVSGGGNLTPSLKYGNKYCYLFVDSESRMYFKYFTKKVDDKTTLKVLDLFYNEVLVFLPPIDVFTFIQSDNGQLDTNQVKAWIRKNKIFSRFTPPYHHFANGFVERAFRSINDLARCMLEQAGLPEPYWEVAVSYAVLIRCILPNRVGNGYVREAYFKWYGITFDYSLLRVFGSRAYALNHVRLKDYGNRSVPGIFVGFKQQNPITTDYCIYLPSKNVFITSADVMFCEHVGRAQPERLLPPLMDLPTSAAHDVSNYQDLVDTVHFDNEECVCYKIIKVYSLRGVASVDRVIYDYENPDAVGGTIDTIFLNDAIGYPILLGKENPEFIPPESSPTLQRLATSQVEDLGVNAFNPTILPEFKENRQARKRRMKAEQESHQAENIADNLRRSSRLRSNTNLASVPKDTKWEDLVAKTVYSWALDTIPDELWIRADNDDLENHNEFNEPPLDAELASSSHASVSHQSNSNEIHYENEPRSHGEAMRRSSEKDRWVAAEDKEVNSLHSMHFAEVVDIPVGRDPLPLMWVYKYKTNEFGERVLYKARLVARGDFSIEGFDYFDTFAPVAKIDSIRLVLAMIIVYQLIPLQLDIDNAFVQSPLKEDVYVKGIPGRPLPPGKCFKLLVSLYGLKNAGYNWNNTCSEYLVVNLGFVRLRTDICVYALFEENRLVAVLALYVDDIILGVDSIDRKDWFLSNIRSRFPTKLIGLPKNVIGLALAWETIPDKLCYKSVKLANIKSVKLLEHKFNLFNKKAVTLPYNISMRLSKDQCPSTEDRLKPEVVRMQTDYRVIVGTCIWLQSTTRPDIMPILIILTKFASNPAFEHFAAAIWLIRYLKGTIHLGLQYSIEASTELTAFVDADHASHESRYSIYCYIFMYAGAPIFWKNGFEERFSLSTAESEIRAVFGLRECTKHILYMKNVFASLQTSSAVSHPTISMANLPIRVFEDNSAAIRYGINPSSQSTMKYFELDILWINDSILRGEFELVKIETKDQLADTGTKFTTSEIFYKLRDLMMVLILQS